MSFTIACLEGAYYIIQGTLVVFYGNGLPPSYEQAVIRLNQYKGSKHLR